MRHSYIKKENLIEVTVNVTPFYTLLGKKFLVTLGEMTYGEWLIYRKNKPVYYLNVFEDCYSLKDLKTGSMENYIENKLKKIGDGFTVLPGIFGIKSFKMFTQVIEVEKMPCSFLEV